MSIKPNAPLIPIMLLLAMMVTSIKPAQALEWDWYGDNRITLTGSINQGDGEGFALLLQAEKFDGLTSIIIGGSDGGSVLDAIEIGAVIRYRGLNTIVANDCTSACVLVASGGVERRVVPGAKLGVHWTTLADPESTTPDEAVLGLQELQRHTWAYYNEVGIKAEAMMFLTLSAGPDIKYLTSSELKNLGWIVQ